MLGAILSSDVTAKSILLSLCIMLVSVVGSSILKYRAMALQTDAGYSTTANKRVQIAEHLRYLPMGYFNENSLDAITSVTTNTMDNLSGVSTRVVMLVTGGLFTTAVMTFAVFLFEWRAGLLIVCGMVVYYLVNRALQVKSEKTTKRKLTGDTAGANCIKRGRKLSHTVTRDKTVRRLYRDNSAERRRLTSASSRVRTDRPWSGACLN